MYLPICEALIKTFQIYMTLHLYRFLEISHRYLGYIRIRALREAVAAAQPLVDRVSTVSTVTLELAREELLDASFTEIVFLTRNVNKLMQDTKDIKKPTDDSLTAQATRIAKIAMKFTALKRLQLERTRPVTALSRSFAALNGSLHGETSEGDAALAAAEFLDFVEDVRDAFAGYLTISHADSPVYKMSGTEAPSPANR
jgi:hypothetical protein